MSRRAAKKTKPEFVSATRASTPLPRTRTCANAAERPADVVGKKFVLRDVNDFGFRNALHRGDRCVLFRARLSPCSSDQLRALLGDRRRFFAFRRLFVRR